MPLTETFIPRGKEKVPKLQIAKILIAAVYLVGIVGMVLPETRPYFLFLTPFHLVFSIGAMLYFHRDWNIPFILFMATAFTVGFLAEVLGVQTGYLFGDYVYGPALGIQLWGVPLIIGVNWLMLVYLTGSILYPLIQSDVLAALLGAALMVGLDLLIEPVAVELYFWRWNQDTIPLSNYLGWFGVAFCLQIVYRKLNFGKSNPLSGFLFGALVVFFASLFLAL